MKASTRITLTYFGCSAAVLLPVGFAMPCAGAISWLVRDGLFLAISTFVLFRLISMEFARRDSVERVLRVQATHDPLTGLVNRAHFQEALDRATARADRGGHNYGIAYIDLNDFKKVNDHHGHHIGDLLLQDVARRIGGVVRASDCAARFGGDEFVILVDAGTEYSVVRLADRLREVFAAPFIIKNLTLVVTASIGIAFYPDHGRQGLSLLQAADKAMYSAKAAREGAAVTALSSAA